MSPPIVKRVVELYESLHGPSRPALAVLANAVLAHELGREPTKKESRELLAQAKRSLAIAKADQAYLAEQSAGRANDGKETQTRGGRHVIRKPGLLGG